MKLIRTPGKWTVDKSPLDNRIVVQSGTLTVCIVGEDCDAVVNDAEFICRAVNSHEQLIEALKKCEDVIGNARLQGKLSDSAFSPVNDALLAARNALDTERSAIAAAQSESAVESCERRFDSESAQRRHNSQLETEVNGKGAK